MPSTDARGLSHVKLTDLRRRGISALQAGESPADVARVLGVHRTTVYGWLARYRTGGWSELDARKRGGRKPKLDGQAMAWIHRAVALGNPQQHQFPFALWSSQLVGALIRQRFGVKLSRASVSRLLNQLGLSARRPLWRVHQQEPAMVERWLREDFPRIRAQAKIKKAEIWFADEVGVRVGAHAGTTWALGGKSPVGSITGARFSLNLISAVNRRGEFRFMGVRGAVEAGVFIAFLKRLMAGARQPIFLIVNGHSTHKTVKVSRFLESVANRLRLFFLPFQSLETIPDERIRNDTKTTDFGRETTRGPDLGCGTVK